MKTKVLCNHFDCEKNCDGKCTRKEILVDKSRTCSMYKQFKPGHMPVSPEYDPPTICK